MCVLLHASHTVNAIYAVGKHCSSTSLPYPFTCTFIAKQTKERKQTNKKTKKQQGSEARGLECVPASCWLPAIHVALKLFIPAENHYHTALQTPITKTKQNKTRHNKTKHSFSHIALLPVVCD